MSADVFENLRRRTAPGAAIAAKLAGAGATEEAAEGATVVLSDNRKVLDFGAYGVTLLGHRHPAVTAAVRTQLDLLTTSTRVLANSTTVSFMEELMERFGAPLERVWLGSDGADAVEVAIKLARRSSGRMRVLAVEHGFHGKTLGALALTWNPAFRKGLEPLLQHVTHIRRDDPDGVAREIATGDVAALVFEPVQGEGGARRLDPALLRRWTRDAHAAGVFVISDEVQAGLRRCGPLCVAADAGIEVDAVLLGKALGGGVMPISALIASDELYEPLRSDPTFHTATFGGHPLACAAGRAALVANDDLELRAIETGARLASALQELAEAYSTTISAIHGTGLMYGLEFNTPAQAGNVLVDLAQAGLLLSPCLSAPRTIRLLPPMVTTEPELQLAIDLLHTALAQLADLPVEDEIQTPGVQPSAVSLGEPEVG